MQGMSTQKWTWTMNGDCPFARPTRRRPSTCLLNLPSDSFQAWAILISTRRPTSSLRSLLIDALAWPPLAAGRSRPPIRIRCGPSSAFFLSTFRLSRTPHHQARPRPPQDDYPSPSPCPSRPDAARLLLRPLRIDGPLDLPQARDGPGVGLVQDARDRSSMSGCKRADRRKRPSGRC